MGKTPNTKVSIPAIDRTINFSSNGDQELRLNEGQPVVSSGSKVNGNAQVHGSVAGVLVHNPA